MIHKLGKMNTMCEHHRGKLHGNMMTVRTDPSRYKATVTEIHVSRNQPPKLKVQWMCLA